MSVPAGVELDRLVAEKVMGWLVGVRHVAAGTNVFGDWQEAEDHTEYIPPGKAFGRVSWFPSVNMGHAMEMAEHLRAQGRHVVIRACGNLGWSAVVSEVDNGGGVMDPWPKQFEEVHQSAPMALCLAALKAVS